MNNLSSLKSSSKIIRSILFVLFCAALSISTAAQNCNSLLSVDKNRNVKSVDENGVTYLLTLTNNSSRTITYDLSAVFSDRSCANKNRQTRSTNVRLNVAFEGNSTPLTGNRISVNAAQSKLFKVIVTRPEGIPNNTWSCIQIQAAGENCGNKITETLLRVFVPDPSEG
jgi:hypothetical protein